MSQLVPEAAAAEPEGTVKIRIDGPQEVLR